MGTEKRRIESLDALRGIFCITIFLNHCTFLKNNSVGDYIFENCLHNGRFGVTFFFLVSGYCMCLSYRNKDIANYISFYKKKIFKFYPLYMLTMGAFAIKELFTGSSLLKVLFKLILSATMLQTCTVKYWGILNSCAWYLSTLFILYLLTPLLLKFIKNLSKNVNLILSAVCITMIPIMDLSALSLSNMFLISGETTNLLTYIFPLYWIPVYFLGMLASEWKFSFNLKKGTCFEIISVLLAIIIYLLGLQGPNIFKTYKSVFYVLSCVFMIYVFSKQTGDLSKILKFSVITYFSKYSLEFYLIHYVVIHCGGAKLFNPICETTIGGGITTILLFMITLLLSVLWSKFDKILRLKYGKNR